MIPGELGNGDTNISVLPTTECDLRNAPLQNLHEKLANYIKYLDDDWGFEGLLVDRMEIHSTHLRDLDQSGGEKLVWDDRVTRRPGYKFFKDFVLGVIIDPLVRGVPGGLLSY